MCVNYMARINIDLPDQLKQKFKRSCYKTEISMNSRLIELITNDIKIKELSK